MLTTKQNRIIFLLGLCNEYSNGELKPERLYGHRGRFSRIFQGLVHDPQALRDQRGKRSYSGWSYSGERNHWRYFIFVCYHHIKNMSHPIILVSHLSLEKHPHPSLNRKYSGENISIKIALIRSKEIPSRRKRFY